MQRLMTIKALIKQAEIAKLKSYSCFEAMYHCSMENEKHTKAYKHCLYTGKKHWNKYKNLIERYNYLIQKEKK